MVVLHQVFHHKSTLVRAFKTKTKGVSPSIMLSSNIRVVKHLLIEIGTNDDLKDLVMAM